MTRSKEADVARLYHAHTRHERARTTEMSLDGDRQPLRFRTYPGAPRTPLPGRDYALDALLGALLERRRSVREFARRPLPLATLGRLLHASYGVRGARLDVEGLHERSAPSAGARYPLEMYVATQAVEGVEDGVYHYDARAHELELRRPGLVQPQLVDIALGQEMVRDANVVVIITAIPERTMWKYGQRGYRYVWLDAGHLGENLYLVATALGLGPVGCGGFFDVEELSSLLALPPGEEPFYLVCVGQPLSGAGGQPMSPRLRLSPSASVTRTGAGVNLRSDLGAFQLTGPDAGAFLDRVVPLLDGTRDEAALVEALPSYSRASVAAFLSLLASRGLVEAVADEARWQGTEAFFRAWSAAEAMERLTRARVLVVGREPWGAVATVELAASGIGEVHTSEDEADAESLIAAEPWTLLVAAIPPGDPGQVARVAWRAHQVELVSLWAHRAGSALVLGPVVTPGHTACRVCATVDALNPPLDAGVPAGAAGALLGHLVALLALQVISAYAPTDLGGRLLVEDLGTLETTLHTLVRLPRCRACGA